MGLKLFLAGGERWWRDFEVLGVRYVLLSFHYLKRQKDYMNMIRWIEQAKKQSTPARPVMFMLDSGAFTFKTKGYESDAALNEYADDYIRYLESDETSQVFDVVAELDVYEDEHTKEGEFVVDGETRVHAWRDRLYDAVGDRLMPVMTAEMSFEDCEELCEDDRFKWVAVASGLSASVPAQKKLIALAHKHRKKVHGFGMTRINTDFKYLRNYDSIDSSTFLRHDKYGGTFIFHQNHFQYIDHLNKHRRTFYKGYFRKIGVDPQKILGEFGEHDEDCPGPDSRTPGCEACTAQIHELRKAAIIAWRNMAAKFDKIVTKADTPMSKPKSKKLIEGGQIYPKRQKASKGPEGPKTLYQKFGGYKCPVYRKPPKDIENASNCYHCENHLICYFTEKAEKGHGFPNPEPPQELLFQQNDEGEYLIGNNLLQGIRLTETQFAQYCAGLNAEQGRKEPVIRKSPERPEEPPSEEIATVSPPPLPAAQKPRKSLPKLQQALPSVDCDSCFLVDECPKYKPGSVCAYNEVFDEYDTRDAEGIVETMKALVDYDKTRTFRAMLNESASTGGQVDPKVTAQMDKFQARLQVLDEMIYQREAPPPPSPTNNNIIIGGEGGSSILSQLFSPPPAPPENDEEIIDIEPEKDEEKSS